MSDNDNGLDLTKLTDAELSSLIRQLVSQLNICAGNATARELIVSYRIKSPEHGNEVKAPRLIVSVMTEVA